MLQGTEIHDITTAVELFSCLRDMQYLNSKNVECLQQMLMIIKRKDLIKKAIEYCHHEREVEMLRICKVTDEELGL